MGNPEDLIYPKSEIENIVVDINQQRMNLMMVLIIAGVCCSFYCLLASIILSCFCMRSHFCNTMRVRQLKKDKDYQYSNSNMVIVYPNAVRLHHKYNEKDEDEVMEKYQASSDESTEYTVSETETRSSMSEYHEEEEKEGELKTTPDIGIQMLSLEQKMDVQKKCMVDELTDDELTIQHEYNLKSDEHIIMNGITPRSDDALHHL